MQNKVIKPIGKIYGDFPTKFGVPRQSGLVNNLSKIVIEKSYSNVDAFRGLNEYSHVWLIWGFSKVTDKEFSPTVRPPRLGGNTKMGVFATRSPFRPNGLGLSSVKLGDIYFDNGNIIIEVVGADLVDGTPIYDIKPYLKLTDCHTDATEGFSGKVNDHKLNVNISCEYVGILGKDKFDILKEILAEDPRPSYQNDDSRIYGFKFSNFEVKFTVKDNLLSVVDIIREKYD